MNVTTVSFVLGVMLFSSALGCSDNATDARESSSVGETTTTETTTTETTTTGTTTTETGQTSVGDTCDVEPSICGANAVTVSKNASR